MKKFISIILALVMTLAIAIPASATDNNQTVVSETHFNEYDYILSLEQASPEELSEMGLSKEQASEIISTFMTALQERATLPDDTLLGYGYTQTEISALRTYNTRSTLSLDAATMRAITGTCTGEISATRMTDKEATFMYSWRWDHAPIMQLKDSVAMRWLAFDKYADDKDVTMSNPSSNINYYWNGSKRFSKSGTWEPSLEFNSVNLQFNMLENFESSTTVTEKAYAGDGHIKVSVKLETGVLTSIKYIKVAGLYGHTTIGSAFPSISLSPPNSISIGFSGNLSIDPIAPAQVKIEPGSSSSNPIVTDLLNN